MEKLASMAGVFMAHAQTEEGMDKLAQAMVAAGELSSDEYEMLKEAGFLSVLKGIGGGLRRAGGAAARAASATGKAARTAAGATARMSRRAYSGARGAVQNVGSQMRARRAYSQAVGKVKAAPAAAAAAPKSRGAAVLRRRGGQVTEIKPMAKGHVADVGQVQQRAPKVEHVNRRGAQQAAQPAQAGQQNYSWETQAPGRVKPAPAASAAPTEPVGAGATTGRKAAPRTQQAPPAAQPTTQQPAAKGKGGFTWGKALPWLAVGGLGYGLYKGVPWAARQLESASSTPMAYGGGWSPVPYGYGYTPYGQGQPSMGFGA